MNVLEVKYFYNQIFKKRYMSLDSDINEIQELHRQSTDIEQKALKKSNELRENIINGKTTGDNIRDFLIVYHGTFVDGDVGQKLRVLKEDIHINQNESILVIETVESLQGCTGFGHSGYVDENEFMKMGIINGELNFNLKKESLSLETFFNKTNGNILIPTSKYIRSLNKGKDWETQEGNLPIESYNFINLDNELPLKMPFSVEYHGQSLQNSMKIFIGYEAISEHFENNKFFIGTYPRALELLH